MRPHEQAAFQLQVVLSHTPYRQLVKHLGDKPVLISGRGNFHHVAREYGFTQSVSTDQLARAWPDALPMSQKGPDGTTSLSSTYLGYSSFTAAQSRVIELPILTWAGVAMHSPY